MPSYDLPVPAARPSAQARTAYLIASGDLREAANRAGWPTQLELEHVVTAAFAALGVPVHLCGDVSL